MKLKHLNITLVAISALCLGRCGSRADTVNSLFEYGRVVGQLNGKLIREASGMSASVVNPGRYWIHNDSGDMPRVFLVDSVGNIACTVNLGNAQNRDWEDIAVGPGPEDGTSYLYIGDIGDNTAGRSFKTIYRLREPRLEIKKDSTIDQTDSIRFVLEDRECDSEAMIVDPLTKDIYIFSKREPKVKLYVIPYPQETVGTDTANLVMTIPLTQVVAADVSHGGDEVLVKTYSGIYYWKRNTGESLVDMLKKKPLALAYIPEPQGESVAFNLDASGYFTTTEVSRGEMAPVMFYPRKGLETK